MMAGIVGYGAYIPRYRIAVRELAYARGHNGERIEKMLAVEEKAAPARDEDSITFAVQASKNALARAALDAQAVEAVYVGSESHPYAVKPSATIIGQALGIGSRYTAADFEFACKGGTAALQAALSMVLSGMSRYALACGTDVAAAAPGDILECATGAGAASFIVGKEVNECCVVVDKTVSVSSDTPDFWRRELQPYPEHTGRFTAEPAYFHHIIAAAQLLFEETKTRPADYNYVVFHQPNGKFPEAVAKKLGFVSKQYETGLLVKKIGNCYSASSLLALTAVLDHALPHQKILMISYGSGSGSDAFSMITTDLLKQKQDKAPSTDFYVGRKTLLTYKELR